MPNTPLPPQPDYKGAAAPVAPAASSSNSSDIWGLGDMYDRPVFLGTQTTKNPVIYSGDGDLKIGAAPSAGTSTEPHYGTTQDLMQQAVTLWAQQAQERKKNPSALTGFEQLQQQLYASGFFGQTAFEKIHVGQWTDQTQSAMVKALGLYEQARSGGGLPVTFTEFLAGNSAQNGDGGFYGSGSTGKAPPQVALQDPETIRAAAQQAAQQALGQGLSAGQLDKFVAQFQAAQSSAQLSTAAKATQPDLSSDAMAYAQQSNPAAFHDTQRQSFLGALVNMLSGPGGANRPSTTPTPAVGK